MSFSPLFTYSIGYFEVYRRFQWEGIFWEGGGRREMVTWADLSREEFLMGEENFP